MSVADLVRMANDIGRFFEAEPKRADAVAAVADHLRRFWDPRMRRQILAHVQGAGPGPGPDTRKGEGTDEVLLPIVRDAVLSLREA